MDWYQRVKAVVVADSREYTGHHGDLVLMNQDFV